MNRRLVISIGILAGAVLIGLLAVTSNWFWTLAILIFDAKSHWWMPI